MKLIDHAKLFLKWAQRVNQCNSKVLTAAVGMMSLDRIDQPNEEIYKAITQDIAGASLVQIKACIRANSQFPYFNINDFLNEDLINKLNGGTSFWDMLRSWIHFLIMDHIRAEIIRTVSDYLAITYLAKNGLKDIFEDDYTRNYFKIENMCQATILSPKVLEVAKRKMTLSLMREFRTNSEKCAANWAFLYIESKTLSKEFLNRLAKAFGENFYAQAIGQLEFTEEEIENKSSEILKQDIIEWNDALIVMKSLTLPQSDFSTLFTKATPAAKNYIRRFLFNDAQQPRVHSYFMLTEDGEALNHDYKVIPMPEWIGIYEVSRLRGSTNKNKWLQIFDDFKIIPL